MSYCQFGNLQNIEIGVRRSKQNAFAGTLKHPQENPPGTPRVLSYSITLAGTRLKIYFPPNELHCLDKLCLHNAHVLFPMKTKYIMTWK